MSVTIQEVAEAAGVSKATVSKVLHKSYSISQETCDRVNAVNWGISRIAAHKVLLPAQQKRFFFWQKCSMA